MQHGEISALLLTADGARSSSSSRDQNLVARWRLDGLGPITSSVDSEATPTAYNADGTLLLTSGSPRCASVDSLQPLAES